MTNAPMAMPTRRVEMWFGGTKPQRRATVIFRFILAIPQSLVVVFLWIAGFFVVIIGWFGALFTGRVPEFAATYLGGVVRWTTRVNAYIFLLTDEYPPFTLEDVEYPVRIILPERAELNRVSVFFRLILAIPASIFAQIVLYGLWFPLLFVMWIVVIATGSMPGSLYDAYAALLRYQARYYTWLGMITSEYAWGMLGDFVPPPQPGSQPPIGSSPGTAPGGWSQPPAQPPAQPLAYPTTSAQAPTPPPDSGNPPVWPPPQPAPTTGAPGAMPPPSSWERTSIAASADPLPPWGILVLRGAARSWMIFAIVWGSIIFIGGNIIQNSRNHNHNHTTTGQLNTVPADTSGLSHIVIHTPAGP